MRVFPEWWRWRYYFLDLPLFSCGIRSSRLEERLYRMFKTEAVIMKEGFVRLCNYLNRPATDSEVEVFLRKTFWVKVIRESDAYTSLGMSKKKLDKYFAVEGMEHVEAAAKSGRPVIILTGHMGSFFIPAIAFSHLGFDVYPLARTVDTSPATPLSTRCYLKLNYRLSEKRFSSARYLFTDFSGRIDRQIVDLGKKGGIFWVAIDFPRKVYPLKRHPVTLFGRPSSLPAGMVHWGIKKEAIFLTGWNFVEGIDTKESYRLLTIDPPVQGAADAGSVLQTYADRLSQRVSAMPWQWMALQVIHQYIEDGGALNSG